MRKTGDGGCGDSGAAATARLRQRAALTNDLLAPGVREVSE